MCIQINVFILTARAKAPHLSPVCQKDCIRRLGIRNTWASPMLGNERFSCVVLLITIKDKDLRSQGKMTAGATGGKMGGAFRSKSLTHAR